MCSPRRSLCKVVLLSTGVLWLVFACGIPINTSVAPVHSLHLKVDKNQREELFSQLRRFADKNAFQVRFSDLGTGGESFEFELWRQDLYVTAGDVHPDPTDVWIDFYPYPGVPINQATFANLYNDLKGLLTATPGITITKAE